MQFNEYIFRKLYVRELWRRLGKEYNSIAVYGCGKHTAWLLYVVADLKEGPIISLYFDDNTHIESFAGVAVKRISSKYDEGFDAILISSDSAEKVMAHKAQKTIPGKPTIEIYGDEIEGPFVLESEKNNVWDNTRLMRRWSSSSRKKATRFRDLHLGERCFVIGNGPSLNKTDLSKLRDEYTIGMNRIYLLFDQDGFSTSYYIAMNKYVLEQCAEEIIAKVPYPKFLNSQCAHLFKKADDIFFLQELNGPFFSRDITAGHWSGSTVTYAALQLAYYLGFQKVILIGVDHSFVTKGPAHELVESQADDPDHFSPEYFGKGFQWQLPDLETSETAYRMAKFAFEQSNREILDATVDGKLRVFPKVPYDNLF